MCFFVFLFVFFIQEEDGIRDLVRSRGLGDVYKRQIVFHLELISPIRRGICHMRGKAYVGDKVVMESEMMAQIVRRDKKKSIEAS